MDNTDNEKLISRLKESLERLSRRRYNLHRRYPFFGSLLRKLQLGIDDMEYLPENFPRSAYTTGSVIRFYPDFLKNLNDAQIDFVLCHEILHVGYLHTQKGRFPAEMEKNRDLLNPAEDFRINFDIVEAGIGEMPTKECFPNYDIEKDPKREPKGLGGCYDKKYDEEWSTTDIYKDLIRRRNAGDLPDLLQFDIHDMFGEEAKGEGEDDRECPPLTQQQVIGAVIQARQIAKSIGKGSCPRALENLLDELLEPKVAWQDEVLTIVSEHNKKYKTWSTPSRRHIHRKNYFPGKGKGETVKFCIALDASGSIGTDEIKVFISEVAGAMNVLEDYELTVLDFSDRVHKHKTYKKGDEIDYTFTESGGTDLSCITDYLVEREIFVDCLFVLTDNYTNKWPDPDYAKKTVFVSTTKVTAPFGETIIYDEL